MRIDGILLEDVYRIENNYDNLEILKIIKYLIGVVVNDVEYMNQEYFEGEERKQIENFIFDLGNGFSLKQEDLESLYSILDTIDNITYFNKD